MIQQYKAKLIDAGITAKINFILVVVPPPVDDPEFGFQYRLQMVIHG